MRRLPDGPTPAPLKRTSPARNESLRQCFLRVAYQADSRFSHVRTLSTAGVIGTVSHRLLECAATGDFDKIDEADLDREISLKWRVLLECEEEALVRWTGGAVPSHGRWPKYALRKAAACRAARRIAVQRSFGPSQPTREDGSYASDKSEVWYEAFGGKLVGRIDYLRRTDRGVEVVDYKSGMVAEADQNGGGNPRVGESYERQVLLYAALVHENEGQWPAKVTVDSLLQGRFEIDAAPDRVQSTVGEALDLLDDYNRSALGKSISGRPSPDSCRWCDFKVVCRDYLSSAEASWSGPSVTIVGRLRNLIPGPPSSLYLEVAGGDHSGESVTVRGLPHHLVDQLSGLEGTILSFGGLRRVFGSSDLAYDWASQGWQWPASSSPLLGKDYR